MLRMNSMAGTRRQFFQQSSLGLGSMVLTHLMGQDTLEGTVTQTSRNQKRKLDLKFQSSQFQSPARAVIQLFQTGGPSQMDLFDPKAELNKRDGKKYDTVFESFQPGSESNQFLASPFRFHRHGESQMEFSELLPNMASVADHWCMVRSMYSDNNNHPQATRCMNTGKIFPGRPTLGAWVGYALGTENQNLPAFVALRDPDGYANGGTTLWDNGWLPALYRGTEIQTRGTPVLNLNPAVKTSSVTQQRNLGLLEKLNQERRRQYPWNDALETRIRNYELAARMQMSAEGLLDLSSETHQTQVLYGMDNPRTADYATRCVMARRLVESGVRFVQVTPPIKDSTMPWDQHRNLKSGLQNITSRIDQPVAALIRDLHQRGLLESTIVLWCGEFGRLPISQYANGRDHNRNAFTVLIAGGGFKGGLVYGATDVFGYKGVQDRVSCPDLLATLFYQLGLNHQEVSYVHNGREETLTDPSVTQAHVVHPLCGRTTRQA